MSQVQEPTAEYARRKSEPQEVTSLFGPAPKKGVITDPELLQAQTEVPSVYYSHPNGQIWCGDSIAWLRSLPSESVDLAFFDPPYGIKKAERDTFESQQEYVRWSLQWIEQAARVLKPTGTLYICGFSEILADLKLPASAFFQGCRWLVWHYKNKANLGGDWGRSHESLLHFRKSKQFTMNMDDVRIPYGSHTLKYPEHPQAESSQYGKGKQKGRLWHPHPNGAKAKDVLEIPRLVMECMRRRLIPPKNPKSCCGLSSLPPRIPATSFLTPSSAPARLLLSPSSLAAAG